MLFPKDDLMEFTLEELESYANAIKIRSSSLADKLAADFEQYVWMNEGHQTFVNDNYRIFVELIRM